MKNKKLFTGLVSAAMIASVVTPISTDVVSAASVKVQNVKVTKAESITVTYVKNGVKYVKTMKPATPVRHLATIVQFKIDNKRYTYKMSKRFQNPNYVSYGRQVAKAKTALSDKDIVTADNAIQAAKRHFKLIKTTYMSVSTLEKANDTLAELEQRLKEIAGGIGSDEQSTASVQNAKVTAPSEITITGSDLNKLKTSDISVSGYQVSSASVNTSGTTVIVKLASAIPFTKSANVTVKANGTTKSFTVSNTIEAKTVSVKSETYDYGSANQKLTLLVDGNEISVDTLRTNGYSVEFTSYNSSGTSLDSGLFSGNAATSSTGVLDSSIPNNSTYKVKVVITKNASRVSSDMTTIYVKDLANRNVRLDIVSATNYSTDNVLYVGSYSDSSVQYRLNQYNTSGTWSAVANLSNYRISSSNANVASVSTYYSSGSDILVTARGAGTATIYVHDLSNRLVASQVVTVYNTDVLKTQAQVDSYLTSSYGSDITLPLNIYGDVSISTNTSQNIVLTGSVSGSLTVNAPNAQVVNSANVAGNAYIQEISTNYSYNYPYGYSSTNPYNPYYGTSFGYPYNSGYSYSYYNGGFINEGTIGGQVIISDPSGSRFTNNGKIQGVQINTPASVDLAGSQAYQAYIQVNNNSITSNNAVASVYAAPGVTATVNGVPVTQQGTQTSTGMITFSTVAPVSKVIPVNYITVTDSNANKNSTTAEIITATVHNQTVRLTETGVNTGVFTNTTTIDLSALATGTRVTVTYYDAANSSGLPQTITNWFTLSGYGVSPLLSGASLAAVDVSGYANLYLPSLTTVGNRFMYTTSTAAVPTPSYGEFYQNTSLSWAPVTSGNRILVGNAQNIGVAEVDNLGRFVKFINLPVQAAQGNFAYQAVANVSAVNASYGTAYGNNGALNVTWTPLNGAASYTITYTAPGGVPQYASVVGGSIASYNLTGLVYNVPYTITVTATNSLGVNSLASAPAYATPSAQYVVGVPASLSTVAFATDADVERLQGLLTIYVNGNMSMVDLSRITTKAGLAYAFNAIPSLTATMDINGVIKLTTTTSGSTSSIYIESSQLADTMFNVQQAIGQG